MLKLSDKRLEDLLSSKLDPLINGEVAVRPGVVLLEESLVLILNSWLSFTRNKNYIFALPQLGWSGQASLESWPARTS